MSIRREHKVQERLERLLREHAGADPARVGGLDEPIVPGSRLSRRTAVRLFEAALQSRLQDLEARRMKDEGRSYYTIGSSGHEANAVFGHLLSTDDPALLHYRSGAFMAARARRGRGETPIFDTMLSFAASAEDPISGGRHKVFGSHSLWVPPQTSTIASHLPKAFGMAFAIGRLKRMGVALPVSSDAIVYCSFGDASVNHATALAGLNAAASASLQHQPCPVIFACEDNGIGISTRTPSDYVQLRYRAHAGLRYFTADGRDLAESHDRAAEAIEFCRRTRQPVFFHLRTVRLMGHAGSDVETVYRSEEELDRSEARDPMLAFADLLLTTGAISRDGLNELHDDLRDRIARAGREASNRPKLRTAAAVREPLEFPAAESLVPRVAPPAERLRAFGGRLPEDDPRDRHLAFRLAQGLKDLLLAYPEAALFGEDVARKGGVYHVTTGLYETFGGGRVFNTILDETTILGLAQAFGTLGGLPIPEIQYLAYVHNALDQIRGEAASLQFFSAGRFRNPMVVRIAGYAYQKGFGGHFHNDNSIGALLDIPGLLIASPSRGDDAVGMLRTLMAAADLAGKVGIFLEPIALYMTKDLLEKGDGRWECAYPAPDQAVPLGQPRRYCDDGDDDLSIVSWANGLHMSLIARERLRADGIRARVLDLRWLAPLPIDAVREDLHATGRLLVVDECRATAGGVSQAILAELAVDDVCRAFPMRRIAGVDSYVPLAEAANLVLVQVDDIVAAARALVATTKETLR
jgi:2-oxoisovalerate dehydrogenase E1 component